jgi:hypothetical protein
VLPEKNEMAPYRPISSPFGSNRLLKYENTAILCIRRGEEASSTQQMPKSGAGIVVNPLFLQYSAAKVGRIADYPRQ